MGQGAGGGALALLPADRTIAAQHAWLSPLPPEGASAIVHRNTDHAPSMSEAQGVNVASPEPKAFCTRMGQAIETNSQPCPTQGSMICSHNG